jgi:nucleoprotein TPR
MNLSLTLCSQERERAVASVASDAQHAELVEKINQLTLLRESNATLRTDSESHAKRAKTLDAKVKALTSELDPLREQARVALAELEAQRQQVSLLEDESRKWQERNTQLLSKVTELMGVVPSGC